MNLIQPNIFFYTFQRENFFYLFIKIAKIDNQHKMFVLK